MDFLNDYFVMVVIGICLCVGYILKNLIPTDKINRFIPLIVGVIGVIINIWHNDFAFTPEILLGGFVSGISSTGMYEAFNQFVKKK